VVTSRLKPQLVRKRTVVRVPPTVKVVVKSTAGEQQIASPKQLKQVRIRSQSAQKQQTPPPAAAPRAKAPPSNAVSQGRNRRGIRRATKVKYVTRGVSPESIAKVNGIRNIGKGKILIIVGNGPSITEAPLEKLRSVHNVDTLSINKPDERLWPTSHWSFFDGSQMRRHENLWTGYNGYVFNSTAIKKQKEKSMQFKNLGGSGFSRDMSKGLHIGRSSVYATMQIALWMGYEHIYIFGCDMNPEGLNGKLHFYGVNPDVEPANRADRFKKEAEHYDTAAKTLNPEERSKFTFCTEYNPWGFVKEFNQMSHKDVSKILEHAASL
jgi:hypothetical protein